MRVRTLYESLSQYHENPWVISLAATPLGGVLIWLLAAFLLWPSGLSMLVPLLLMLVMIKPERVEAIMGLGSVWVLYEVLNANGVWGWTSFAAGALIVLLLCYLVVAAARSFHSLPTIVRKYPLILLHAAVLSTLICNPFIHSLLGKIHPALSQVITAVILLAPFMAWRFAYLIQSARKRPGKVGGLWNHLYYFLPLYGGFNLPYGKGRDYLSSKQARDPERFARSQLAGLRLLSLAWLWIAAMEVMDVVVYGEKGRITGFSLKDYHPAIFHLKAMILGEVPQHVPLYLAWAGVFFDLIYATLSLAIFGHFIIGCLRLFGFNVFRNTYKPLLAQSIVDFWNRYFYYFKELLVEFFFYPTFLAYFKSWPKIRIYAAVMTAAFLGNVYYHVLKWLARGQLSFFTGRGVSTQLEPYIFYAFLLGTGVFVSMLREQERRGKPQGPAAYPRLHAIRRIAGVWLFFGLIRIWDVDPAATFGERMDFFRSLFAI